MEKVGIRMKERCEAAIDKIIADLSDRGGIGDEWDQIDDDIKELIRNKWIQILEEKINGGTK